MRKKIQIAVLGLLPLSRVRVLKLRVRVHQNSRSRVRVRVRVRKFDRNVKFKIWPKLFQYGRTLSEIPQEDVCASVAQSSN